jgi:hypothetical protein
MKFSATLERIGGGKAIVTLYDSAGQWSGAFLITRSARWSLYERGYLRASQEAAVKGGALDRYSVASDEQEAR